MPLKPVAAAVFALALSSFAPARAEPPAASAAAHPATSAHANAVAGESDAARIEACAEATGAMIDRLAKGDYQGATADFDAQMQAGLGADKLGEVWRQVGSQAGKLEGRGAPQNALHAGMVIVVLPLRFEKAELGAQVACNAEGKIAGFYLRPAAPASSGTP